MIAVRLKPAIFLPRIIPAASKSTAGFYKCKFPYSTYRYLYFSISMSRDIYFQ